MGLVHGERCGTRTWPTHCSSCGEEVFFFTCGHGSKVFFDELGHPWPIHDCDTSWTRSLNRTIIGDGEIIVELRPGIFAIRSSDERNSFAIEQSVVSKARAIKKEQKQDPIVAIKPERALSESHIGTLRVLRHSVDPLKAYKLEDTRMGRAMLGPIGTQEVGKITVHVPYPSDNQIESFTAWIPTKLLLDQRIMNDLTVALDLETVNVPGHGYAWFCDRIETLG